MLPIAGTMLDSAKRKSFFAISERTCDGRRCVRLATNLRSNSKRPVSIVANRIRSSSTSITSCPQRANVLLRGMDPMQRFVELYAEARANPCHDPTALTLSTVGPPLVTIYLVSDVGSIAGGWLSSSLIGRGWSINAARKTAMLVCALAVTPIAAVAGGRQARRPSDRAPGSSVPRAGPPLRHVLAGSRASAA